MEENTKNNSLIVWFVLVVIIVSVGTFFLVAKQKDSLRIQENIPSEPLNFDDQRVDSDPTQNFTRLGESVQKEGVIITPISIIEDSRCPADVECIWAGRFVLQINVALNEGRSAPQIHNVVLGEPLLVYGHTIVLRVVEPYPDSKVSLASDAYHFNFDVIETDIPAKEGMGALQKKSEISESEDTGIRGNENQADIFQGVHVNYTASGFVPNTVTIKKGQTVRWINDSGSLMWVASDSHPTHGDYPIQSSNDCLGSSFDECKSGDMYEFTFTEVGEWKYHNHRRSKDTGKIIVK